MTAEQVIGYCGLVLLAVIAASIVGYLSTRPLSLARLRGRLVKDFPELQSDFFAAGQKIGKPRGLVWKRCEWDSEPLLARDRTTEDLVALVPITLHFESTTPGKAPSQPASALFFYTAGRWHTLGQAIFNLRPTEVLTRLAHQYEPASS